MEAPTLLLGELTGAVGTANPNSFTHRVPLWKDYLVPGRVKPLLDSGETLFGPTIPIGNSFSVRFKAFHWTSSSTLIRQGSFYGHPCGSMDLTPVDLPNPLPRIRRVANQ